MIRTIATTSVLASILSLAASLSATAQQWGDFELLGNEVYPTDASLQGAVVCGFDQFTASNFMITPDVGFVSIPGTPAWNGVGGNLRVSDDGLRISIAERNPTTDRYEMSFYDTWLGFVTNCGGLGSYQGSSTSSGYAISGDGSTLVGLGWLTAADARAMKWKDGVVTNLGTAVFLQPTRANGVNYDGSVICGWQDTSSGFRQGCVWVNGVETVLKYADNVVTSEAQAVSADGTWVVGGGTNSRPDAWRWSAATGVQSLGIPPAPGIGYATDISSDGSRILCFFRPPSPPEPTGGEGYLWIEGRGFVELRALAEENGTVDIPADIHMALPLGLSPDGYTVVGESRTDFGRFGFILRLPETAPCPADLDGSGAVDGADLAALLSGWGLASGDVTGDGTTDGEDLAAVLGAWGSCP